MTIYEAKVISHCRFELRRSFSLYSNIVLCLRRTSSPTSSGMSILTTEIGISINNLSGKGVPATNIPHDPCIASPNANAACYFLKEKLILNFLQYAVNCWTPTVDTAAPESAHNPKNWILSRKSNVFSLLGSVTVGLTLYKLDWQEMIVLLVTCTALGIWIGLIGLIFLGWLNVDTIKQSSRSELNSVVVGVVIERSIQNKLLSVDWL